MLFHVTMDVRIPHDADPARIETLKAEEKARAHELQRAGIWRHLWRVAGRYSNVSIFDVPGNAELHDILSGLRSEEHTSELQSLMRISYAVFCLKKKNIYNTTH